MKFNYNKKFNGKVYYSGPYWDDKEIDAAAKALREGKWLSAGENVHRFEYLFAKKFKTGFAHMVNSGSSANLVLIAGLKRFFKWEDGAEIIVSPVGFPTTIAPIYQNQLTPVFADIEFSTLNFDLNEVEKKITSKTVAVFLSPVLGNPPHLDSLISICDKKGIMLILDNCDSLGTKWNNKYLNEYSIAWTTSFYPAHHITTGEGGMVCTNIKELNDVFRSLSWWGRSCYCVGVANLAKNGTCGKRFDKWLDSYDGIIDHKYVFSEMGYNLKPLDLQGAIGIEQLKKFDEISEKRKANKQIIQHLFEKYTSVRGVTSFKEADVCWFGVPLKSHEKHKLVEKLELNNIQTRNYFAGNILMHPGYEALGDYKDYPEANKVLDQVFFVGCSPHYTEKVFDYIKNVLE